MLKAMELSPAKNRGKCEAEQHGIEENEPADSGVRVLEENHHGDQPNGGSPEVELPRREVRQWNADSPEKCVKHTHEGVVELLWICLSRLEFKRPIVPCHVSREADQHLSEWGMDIEVELALKVMRTELPETGLRVSNAPKQERGWPRTVLHPM